MKDCRAMRACASWACIALAVIAGCGRRESAAPPAPDLGPAAAQAQATPPAALPDATRRVIRTAELALETDAPDRVEQQITTLAESKGGFVVSSDTSRDRADDGAESVAVTLVFRVPAAAFDGTL